MVKKSWWKDPQKIYDSTNLIVAVLAMILVLIEVFKIMEIKFFADNIIEIILFLVAFSAISNVIERRVILKRIEENLTNSQIGPYKGITRVYSNRSQLPSFEDMVENAEKEIFIVGINLVTIALYQLDTLKNKAESGCRLKLLLLDPGSEELPNPIIKPLQSTMAAPDLDLLLEPNLKRFTYWTSQLADNVSDKIEIRVTKSIPFGSVTIIDKHSPTGKLFIGAFVPNMRDATRMFIQIDANNGGEVYSSYIDSYDKLWEDAKVWASK